MGLGLISAGIQFTLSSDREQKSVIVVKMFNFWSSKVPQPDLSDWR